MKETEHANEIQQAVEFDDESEIQALAQAPSNTDDFDKTMNFLVTMLNPYFATYKQVAGPL